MDLLGLTCLSPSNRNRARFASLTPPPSGFTDQGDHHHHHYSHHLKQGLSASLKLLASKLASANQVKMIPLPLYKLNQVI